MLIRNELSDKFRDSYKELSALLDPTTNYASLRGLQNTAPTPCLPYIGILLQDLLSMEEIESKQVDGLINFKKNRRLAAAFEFIHSRQKVPCIISFFNSNFWFFILVIDTNNSFDSMPPEHLAPYLASSDLVVLPENEQYRFSSLAESRDAIKAAGL
jgi:hypothetical protein